MLENHQVKAIFLKIKFEKARSGSIAFFSRVKAHKKEDEIE
jgi:hypothetical protein